MARPYIGAERAKPAPIHASEYAVSRTDEPIPVHAGVRYVTPLKEGGSLPAVVDTDDAGLFVVKFRGAGQGAKALIAETVFALLARELGLPVPEIAIIEMADDFGRTQADPEIQDILVASRGLNFGIRYLDGALNFDPVAAADLVTPSFATDLVWLDAYLTNPDRSHRNPNLMVCEDQLWLIDHGAALFAHHNWSRVDTDRTRTPFAPIEDHVLLDRVDDLQEADRQLTAMLDERVLERTMALVPDTWLIDPVSGGDFDTASEARARYRTYLTTRLAGPRAFVQQAVEAKGRVSGAPPGRLSARR